MNVQINNSDDCQTLDTVSDDSFHRKFELVFGNELVTRYAEPLYREFSAGQCIGILGLDEFVGVMDEVIESRSYVGRSYIGDYLQKSINEPELRLETILQLLRSNHSIKHYGFNPNGMLNFLKCRFGMGKMQGRDVPIPTCGMKEICPQCAFDESRCLKGRGIEKMFAFGQGQQYAVTLKVPDGPLATQDSVLRRCRERLIECIGKHRHPGSAPHPARDIAGIHLVWEVTGSMTMARPHFHGVMIVRGASPIGAVDWFRKEAIAIVADLSPAAVDILTLATMVDVREVKVGELNGVESRVEGFAGWLDYYAGKVGRASGGYLKQEDGRYGNKYGLPLDLFVSQQLEIAAYRRSYPRFRTSYSSVFKDLARSNAKCPAPTLVHAEVSIEVVRCPDRMLLAGAVDRTVDLCASGAGIVFVDRPDHIAGITKALNLRFETDGNIVRAIAHHAPNRPSLRQSPQPVAVAGTVIVAALDIDSRTIPSGLAWTVFVNPTGFVRLKHEIGRLGVAGRPCKAVMLFSNEWMTVTSQEVRHSNPPARLVFTLLAAMHGANTPMTPAEARDAMRSHVSRSVRWYASMAKVDVALDAMAARGLLRRIDASVPVYSVPKEWMGRFDEHCGAAVGLFRARVQEWKRLASFLTRHSGHTADFARLSRCVEGKRGNR